MQIDPWPLVLPSPALTHRFRPNTFLLLLIQVWMPPHLPAPFPPPLAPPIPRYSAKAGRHHIEPPLTLSDPSSSSPSAAQQHSWVCMHSHPHRTQMCRGVVCPWRGQGWLLRLVEEQRADGGRHALWLYMVVSFALYVLISICSLYVSVCSLSPSLKSVSSSIGKLRPVILFVLVLPSCWTCQNSSVGHISQTFIDSVN